MNRTHAVALVAVIVVSGCASSEPADEVPTSKGAPTPGQEVFPVVASSERAVGENRFLIGLIDTNDAPIRSPKTTLHVGFVGPGDQAPSSTTTMRFLWIIKPIQGLWVGEATFDEAGQWEAVIEVKGGGYDTSVRTVFEVNEEGTTPEIGEKPPAVDTPTIADVSELSEITIAQNRPEESRLGIALAVVFAPTSRPSSLLVSV